MQRQQRSVRSTAAHKTPRHAARQVARRVAPHATIRRRNHTAALYKEQLPVSLPKLKYSELPGMSAETFQYHHGKHHNTYVTNLNKLVAGTPLENASLKQVIVDAHTNKKTGVFNNAAQHLNHSMFWSSLTQKGGGLPQGALAEHINRDFGNFETFREQFATAATTHFGSGWVFLVFDPKAQKVAIESHHDASTPLVNGTVPLLNCDVWEHAYYIDHRNNRAAFVNHFLDNLVNWDYAQTNLAEVQDV